MNLDGLNLLRHRQEIGQKSSKIVPLGRATLLSPLHSASCSDSLVSSLEAPQVCIRGSQSAVPVNPGRLLSNEALRMRSLPRSDGPSQEIDLSPDLRRILYNLSYVSESEYSR